MGQIINGKNRLNSDSYILSDLQNGKEEAFDFIFRKYFRALCVQANGYVKDLDLAQSLVQDCFIKLWERRSQVTEIENLSSYLSFMVRNKCLDHLRKEKRTTELVDGAPEEIDDHNSETQLLSREFEEKLVEALALLPDRCRIAFEYSRFEGLTYTEIASKMNITNKAVEALMSRSLKILRSELKDYLPIVLLLHKLFH